MSLTIDFLLYLVAEFTYDAPEEVAEAFGGSLQTSLTINDEAGIINLLYE